MNNGNNDEGNSRNRELEEQLEAVNKGYLENRRCTAVREDMRNEEDIRWVTE